MSHLEAFVDSPEWGNDHGQVGHGVPELGDVRSDDVVLFAPVDQGRGFAPKSFVHINRRHNAES